MESSNSPRLLSGYMLNSPCSLKPPVNIATNVASPAAPKPLDINGGRSFPVDFPEYQIHKVDHIRQMLLSTSSKDSMETLMFVDMIQQVGLSHYFQDDIQMILRKHFETTAYKNHSSLHDVSLSFRLLRQHGHGVSPDVLKISKLKNGMFKGDREEVIRGLMELYEAAQLSFEGEYELYEAANISSQILSEHFADVEYNLSPVSFRLLYPCHKSISGLTNKRFIQDFVDMNGWEKALRELATIDICERQSVYRKEFHQISKWWNELGIATELELVRNQPLKWYTWTMAALVDDLSLSRERVQLIKPIAFVYLLDDIFDLYGTPDELMIFAEAVNKWDYAAMETLPDYMKMTYKALLDTTNEIALNIHENDGYNPIDSLKTTWSSLCYAFLEEAKWFASGEMLTSEKYLKNAIVSSGGHVVLVHLFFLLGLGGTQNNEIELKDISELVHSVATILRLYDDLGSAKDEHQDGKDGSYIDYFMEEHPSITIEQAREHVMELIASAWRRLNQECFALNSSSTVPFKTACLNLARMVSIMYTYDENKNLPVLKEYVNLMLFNETSLE